MEGLPTRALGLVIFLVSLVLVLLLSEWRTMPVQNPEQIHIGLGNQPSEMRVQWATIQSSGQVGPPPYSPGESYVMYGLSQEAMTNLAHGVPFMFHDYGDERRNYTFHMATLQGLAPSTIYYYAVGGNRSGWSTTFSFKTAPNAETLPKELPMTYAIFGDQGDFNGQTLPFLEEEARKRRLDMVLHVGDMAYNLDSDNGRNGDAWMRDIEPLAASVPYMVSLGNHESAQNYNHYTQRFRLMPSNSGNISMPEFGTVPNNWWYSWDNGLVHFVAVSTEVYFTHHELLPTMHAWLEQDLAAVDRKRTPWVIAHGHRPVYCSCDGDCDADATTVRMGVQQPDGSRKYGLEELFYKHGVDLFLAGHEHDYERMYDVAPRFNPKTPWLSGVTTRTTVNPPATTYVITGSAGSVEGHEPFLRRKPARVAKRLNTFGWSRMVVHNSTHLLWQQVQTDIGQPSKSWGSVQDEAWLVQNHHGPFPQHPSSDMINNLALEESPEVDKEVTDHTPSSAPTYARAGCRHVRDTDEVCRDERFNVGMKLLGRWQFTRGLADEQELGQVVA